MGPMKKAVAKTPMKKTMKEAAVMKKGRTMKAKRVSIIARGKFARAQVFLGRKQKTPGGLTAATLTKSKTGKIVSKAASLRAKKNFANSPLKKFCQAVQLARKQLGIKGFCPVGGQSPQGKALLAKTKSILAN